LISSRTFIAFTKFGLVGGLSFLVDMSVYYGMATFLPTYFAKALGILVATFVNYKLNTYWTWETKKSDMGIGLRNETLKKYLMLYALSGGINVGTNEFMLALLPNWELQLNLILPQVGYILDNHNGGIEQLFAVKIDKLFAVLTATVVGMGINFLGQKLWVFGGSDKSSANGIND